ncbi:MAG: VWA domain-containing protein [Vicinamibacteria bacterium]|nr:VWA domain-containing protein [Vicinamibacteria bacterium]
MNAQIDRALIGTRGNSRRYLMVTLTAPEASATAAGPRPPANVAVVLDRSGSMQGEKIHLAKQAASGALGLLKRSDRFAVVVYDHEVDVLVPSSPVGPESLQQALRALERVEARGNTALHEGWKRGCDQVAAELTPEAVGKCLLLTDGLANAGLTEPDALGAECEGAQARRVVTSTFGVGRDFDERLLDLMATKGGGNFYFVDHARQIPEFLARELAETLEVVARDVRLEIRVPQGVRVRALNNYPVEETASGLRCNVSNLISNQELTLVFQLTLPAGAVGETVAVECAVSDRDNALALPPATVTWTFAEKAANSAQPRNRVVDRGVARIYATRARREALEANRESRFGRAREILERAARRIERYAGNDPELQEVVAELRRDLREYSVQMEEMSRKAHYFRAYSSSKDRDLVMGTARRSSR